MKRLNNIPSRPMSCLWKQQRCWGQTGSGLGMSQAQPPFSTVPLSSSLWLHTALLFPGASADHWNDRADTSVGVLCCTTQRKPLTRPQDS